MELGELTVLLLKTTAAPIPVALIKLAATRPASIPTLILARCTTLMTPITTTLTITTLTIAVAIQEDFTQPPALVSKRKLGQAFGHFGEAGH